MVMGVGRQQQHDDDKTDNYEGDDNYNDNVHYDDENNDYSDNNYNNYNDNVHYFYVNHYFRHIKTQQTIWRESHA